LAITSLLRENLDFQVFLTEHHCHGTPLISPPVLTSNTPIPSCLFKELVFSICLFAAVALDERLVTLMVLCALPRSLGAEL